MSSAIRCTASALQLHPAARGRAALGHRLVADVDHARATGLVDVGQAFRGHGADLVVVAVTRVDPARAVGPVLAFPDRHCRLDQLDRLLARRGTPCRGAARRRPRRTLASPIVQRPGAVHDRDGADAAARVQLLADASHLRLRHLRVRLVVHAMHGDAVAVVAHPARRRSRRLRRATFRRSRSPTPMSIGASVTQTRTGGSRLRCRRRPAG